LAQHGGERTLHRSLRLDSNRYFRRDRALVPRVCPRQPAAWPSRPSVLTSLASALSPGDCVDLGLANIGALIDAPRTADFLAITVGCADTLPDGDARKQEMRDKGARRLDVLVHNPNAPLSADDRGDGLRILRQMHEQQGDKQTAHALAEEQKARLDDTAATAATPLEASTDNFGRLEVYQYLGRGAELIQAKCTPGWCNGR
jgi:hypothetical protein